MGITVTENFRRPYFSKNIKEYWKRWHITMGTWFRDYVFYPLSVSKTVLKLHQKARAKLGEPGKRVCYGMTDLGNPEPKREGRNFIGMKTKLRIGSLLPIQLSCCAACRGSCISPTTRRRTKG